MRIAPPEIVPVEPGIVQYQYEGHCPLCHVSLAGCFWIKRDQTTGEPKASGFKTSYSTSN